MPYIEIIEKDETNAGNYAESNDVVYIPGFVNLDDTSLYKTIKEVVDGETKTYTQYIGLEVNKPRLFTSVSEFESYCGKQPARFKTDQRYSSLFTPLTDGSYTGFDKNAIPYDDIMFHGDSTNNNEVINGDYDPSYIMAKECLSYGLNVLYERINEEPEYVEFGSIGTLEPQEFKNNKSKFGYTNSSYVNIRSVTPPTYSKIVGDGKQQFVEGVIYFTAVINEETNVITAFNKATVTPGEVVPTDKEFYFVDKLFYSRTATEVEGKIKYTYTLVNATLDSDNVISEMLVYPENWVSTYKDYFETTNEIVMYLIEDKWKTDVQNYSKENNINIITMYNALEGVYDINNFDGLVDKGNYSIKYLTSGGYPVYEYKSNAIVNNMINMAKSRGDCVAIIDHTDNVDRTQDINKSDSVYGTVKVDTTFANDGEFGTMFTPWAIYNRVTKDSELVDGVNKTISTRGVRLPASFAYLIALADSIKTNANWLAIAGSTRGVVLNLAQNGMTTNIANGVADKMQPRDSVAVNAITNVRPFGFTIWGNRTLKNNVGNLTATSFLNIRNLVSDVKKEVYRAARQLTFEQNNDILWINFKSLISPLLDQMTTGYGISGYKIIRDNTHEKASEKATICAKILLYPVFAVEDFYVTVVLKDDEITIE